MSSPTKGRMNSAPPPSPSSPKPHGGRDQPGWLGCEVFMDCFLENEKLDQGMGTPTAAIGQSLVQKISAAPAQILAVVMGTACRSPAAAAAAVAGEHSRATARTLAVAVPHKGEGQPVLGGSDKSQQEDRSEIRETSPPEGRRGQREPGGESKSPAEQKMMVLNTDLTKQFTKL